MTIKLMCAFILSFLFATGFGKYYIPWLRRQKANQEIKSEVEWHKSKAGTPTMGGVMFILGVLLSLLTIGFPSMMQGRFVHLFVFLFALVFGAIGFLDDWEKIKNSQNMGLTASMKFLLQLSAALVFIFLMRRIGFVRPNLYIPFVGTTVPIPEWLYFIFAAFVIVGTVNAVNLTDGVDGLVGSVTFFVAVSFMLVASKVYSLGVTAVSAVVAGACLGFLLWNFHPARVFMGDTGSLFLGGIVCALAFAVNMPILLLPLGIIYLCEMFSVMLQVGYFKLTHGKRLFRMAPIHHHFEMCGWSEVKVVGVFSLVTAGFGVLAFLSVLFGVHVQ